MTHVSPQALIIGCLIVAMMETGFADRLSPKHTQSEGVIINRMIQAYLDGSLGPTCDQLPGLADDLWERLGSISISKLRQEIQYLDRVFTADLRLALLQVVADPATTRADILDLTLYCEQRVLESIPACEPGNAGDFRCYRIARR